MAHGTYIYGIGKLDANLQGGRGGSQVSQITGIGDATVGELVHGDLVALTSELEIAGKLRPQRKHLAAHQRVLREAGADATVLPMAFGVVADDAEGVRTLLDEHAEALHAELERVDGCVEMGLKLRWIVENIFEHFVSEYPDLRERRDEIARLGDAAPHDLRVQTGRLFGGILESERHTHQSVMLDHLEPICRDIDRQEPADESLAVSLSCLVERDRVSDFEAAVEAAAHDYDERYGFELSGPWAPHSFVQLDLSLNGVA